MSFVHGSNAELWLAGADISEYFNALGFTATVDTGETTTFKKRWKTHLPGQAGATLETGGLFDPTFTPNLTSILAAAAGSVLTAGPGGMEAVGDLARLVSVKSTSYKESAPVGGIVAFNWNVLADGPVGFGVVLHPLGAETGDDDGDTHIGPVGGTDDGAIAHLHVTSVSASDEIDVTIEDSANGSDWAPIAGGAFATVTAAGAQRLLIPGTIRRYTRASWDVTGTDVSIAFAVALARL